jgi:aryl-alcohol dehydrogenase-like predicted oxidoreductase
VAQRGNAFCWFERHDGTPAQVALAWAMEKGIVEIDNFQESIRTIDGSWEHYPFD